MKILWQSVAPWIPTGYGYQSALFGPRIRDLGHDFAYSAYVGIEGCEGNFEGMTVYPADITKWNKRALKRYVKRHGAGEDVLVITLTDVWTWTEMRYGGYPDWEGLNIASWVPIDHDPCPDPVVHSLNAFNARPIAMSRFGEDRLRHKGFDPLYVPHGVDTSVFQPRDDRDGLREAFGFPKDKFVIGVVANNSGPVLHRKAMPQILMAFRLFLEEHPDSLLYLHTDIEGINLGMNLANQCNHFGIPPDAVSWVNQDAYEDATIPPARMAATYACMDVLANPSLGEGFGVPIIEAQACGVPVIVNDHTSMPELCGAGWIVDGQHFWHDEQDAFWKVPDVVQLADAFASAYEARGDQALRDKAAEFAQAYDADRVTETYWKPVLETLSRPREVQPLRPRGNRAQRRAAARKGVAA